MITTFKTGQLIVNVYENRVHMGTAAAQDVLKRLRELLEKQAFVNMIFAAAPSQKEILAAFGNADVDWARVRAFHMDEYIGLEKGAVQGFGNFLNRHLFSRLPFAEVYYLNGSADDLYRECQRYSTLLTAYPPDIVCMGIGENGHIAFNDPHVADFNDDKMVKVVMLDQACRQQQVNDGCFSTIDIVPNEAITLTIPALMTARYVFCVVPGKSKANAIANTLFQEVSEVYPATILRKHSNAWLYLDADSYRQKEGI